MEGRRNLDMPEPYRSILEVLLTALFGLNMFMMRGFSKRADQFDKRLSEHEDKQADTMLSIDREMSNLRSNYKDRFAEVNMNIFNLERKVLEAVNTINVNIARLQERNGEK